MNNQHRAMYMADATVVRKLIEWQKREVSEHAISRQERALQHQPSGRASRGKINRRTGADRTAEDDDAVRRNSDIDSQIVISRAFIFISGRFGRFALAGSITLVIEGEHTEACTAKVLEPVADVAQIFRIAMADQQGENPLRIGKIES